MGVRGVCVCMHSEVGRLEHSMFQHDMQGAKNFATFMAEVRTAGEER